MWHFRNDICGFFQVYVYAQDTGVCRTLSDKFCDLTTVLWVFTGAASCVHPLNGHLAPSRKDARHHRAGKVSLAIRIGISFELSDCMHRMITQDQSV